MVPEVRDVEIRDAVIRLGQFLQLANVVDTGSDAKAAIAADEVSVNGRIESRRGLQLRPGDRVAFRGAELRVASAQP